MPFWLTCNVIVDKGLSVEYKSPSIDILDFGKSWTVTATAKVPLFVWLAKKNYRTSVLQYNGQCFLQVVFSFNIKSVVSL